MFAKNRLPVNRVCFSNSYCRTRSFSDAPTVGILSSYYEAMKNDDNTWEVFQIDESPCPNTGKMIAKQVLLKTGYPFDSVLRDFYLWETGAEVCNCIFANTREDFGLDHFHTLAHAEGLAFKSDGNVVETRNGRIVSAGTFTVEEKELARQDHLNPVPPKKLERQALADIFTVHASKQETPDIQDILNSKTGLENSVNFYKALLKDVARIEEEINKILPILNNILLKTNPDIDKLEFSYVGSTSTWSILDEKPIKKKFIHAQGREIFSSRKSSVSGGMTNFRCGPLHLDDFEDAFKEAKKLKNIAVPDHIVDLFKEFRFFGSYLHAKGIFHWETAETKLSDLKRKAFLYSQDVLKKDYGDLPSYLQKPDWASVEKLITSKAPEKMPELLTVLKEEIEKIITSHAQNLADFENVIENRTPPKQRALTP